MICLTKLFQQKRRRIGYILAFSAPTISKRDSSDQYYDNYDAIEVPYSDAIPCDYEGMIGVPITFFDKYCPEQFEIVGITKTWFGMANKVYPKQIQVSKTGKKTIVTKLNDGPVIELDGPLEDEVYYIVEGKYYTQAYARILIRKKQS